MALVSHADRKAVRSPYANTTVMVTVVSRCRRVDRVRLRAGAFIGRDQDVDAFLEEGVPPV